MKRRSFCEWIPILPWPVWPLAWQRVLGQNTVVGSMTLLLAMRGNIVTRSMSGPPFALQLHCTTVWCRGTQIVVADEKSTFYRIWWWNEGQHTCSYIPQEPEAALLSRDRSRNDPVGIRPAFAWELLAFR